MTDETVAQGRYAICSSKSGPAFERPCDRCAGERVIYIAPNGDPDEVQDIPCPVCGVAEVEDTRDGDYERADRAYGEAGKGGL